MAKDNSPLLNSPLIVNSTKFKYRILVWIKRTNLL